MSKKSKKRTGPGGRAAGNGPEAAAADSASAVKRFTGPWSRANLIEWGKNIAVAVLLALVIRWAFIEPYRIPSGSMLPTLQIGDRLFVNKWIYGLRWPFTNTRIFEGQDPQRWDIVVFRSVEDDPEFKILVKRIVGLPGERIQIQDGKVYVDGSALELPEDLPDIAYWAPGPGQPLARRQFRFGVDTADEFAVIPPGHYFLLGDNSTQSRDGRVFGWVPNGHLLGPVFTIWWPISRWHDFTGFSQTWWWRTLVAALALLVAVRLWVGRSWHLHAAPGAAPPEPPLAVGDHLYVHRLAFGLPLPFTRCRLTRGREPVRGEWVAYEGPKDSPGRGRMFIGRVAGLPGEQVFLNQGVLEINGEPLAGPAELRETRFSSDEPTGRYAKSKGREYAVVPEGHYFILGAAADEAGDSRVLGWVPRAHLVGTVAAVWWPLRRVQQVPRPDSAAAE